MCCLLVFLATTHNARFKFECSFTVHVVLGRVKMCAALYLQDIHTLCIHSVHAVTNLK